MKKTNSQRLGDVLKEYMREMQDKAPSVNPRIPVLWEKVMGKNIAIQTKKIYLKDHTLIVYLNSSILRNELMMMRGKIIERMNQEIGTPHIHQIILH